MLVAQIPAAALPLIALGGARQRQDLADDLVQTLAEDFAQARTLQRLFKTGILGADVLRQSAFAPEVIEIIFVGRKHKACRNFQALGDTRQKTPGQLAIGAVIFLLIGDQRVVLPDRHAVASPVAIERPARQLLTGVPLALPEMHQPLRRVASTHALEQLGGQSAFIRPQRRRVPLGAVRVIDGHEGWLTAHGQAHIAFQQVGIDLPTQGLNRQPLIVGVRLGDAGRLPNPLNRHFVAEFALARFHQTRDRCRRGWIRTTGQRNVSFTGK
ncbi:hypothetical protein D3C72_968660 [compost metagenome]